MENNDYINPFDEVFDENDVVNRGDIPLNFDEEFDKNDVVNSPRKAPKVISPIDMADIISSGDKLTLRSITEKEDEEEFFGLIKKKDVDSGKVVIRDLAEDFPIDQEPEYQMDLSDLTDDLLSEEIEEEYPEPVPSIPMSRNEYYQRALKKDDDSSPEEQIEKYLQKNFQDFMSIPKISGSFTKSIENNLIPKEVVTKTGKTIEIADDLPHTNDSTHQSSIIINRDEAGELESMEVICKCGERTLIQFDYVQTKDMDDVLTEIEDDPYEPIPFDELIQNREDVVILSPESLKIPTYEEIISDEEENDGEDYDEDEEDDEDDDDYDDYED